MPQIGSLHLLFLIVMCGCLLNLSECHLIQDLKSRGLDIGGGLSVHLDTVPAPSNSSIFQRHALRFDYNGLGLRLGVDSIDDTYKVGLYYGEGRNSKWKEISQFIVPALLGYKTSALTFITISGVAMLVLKALLISKMAAVLSIGLWVKKLFGGQGKEYRNNPVELDHHPSELHPVYAEYPGDIADLGYAQTAAGNYIAYAAPHQDITGEMPVEAGGLGAPSQHQYTFVEAPANVVATATTPNNVTSQRRRGAMISRPPQAMHTYITVKRKSVSV